MGKNIRRVLIANRGEIAVRVIRACREMGIESVAVFSDADTKSLHVSLADYAVRIGPGPAASSYLRSDRILEAARESGADAIHPGYGLLSENGDFAQAILEAGLTFLGPKPEAIRSMGNKTEAKRRMQEAGVPVVPGSEGPVADLDAGKALLGSIGLPLLIKAVAGGGGRGMRVVEEASQFGDAFESAAREAKAAFGNGSLYIERYLHNPRHIEIQVMADQHGNVVFVGERECSVQRRHQKIIEESPSAIVTEDLRNRMGEAAVRAASAVKYEGAGTVEFLVDQKGEFYFIEMNTRLQVEHPVTELVYGIDLVREQIRVARGETLSFDQNSLTRTGHAVECRICAEDPDNGYRPCPGMITGLRLPGGPGIRLDTNIYDGYQIPVHYDPMIAKLITWGQDRETAIRRMESALSEMQVQGIKTNIGLLQKVLAHEAFRSGQYHTHFLRDELASLSKVDDSAKAVERVAAISAALSDYLRRLAGAQYLAQPSTEEQDRGSWRLTKGSWRTSGLRRQTDR